MSIDEIKVTDSYLSAEEFNVIQSATRHSSGFEWRHHKQNPDADGLFNHQFTHHLNYKGEWEGRRDIFEPIVEYLNAFLIVRVKVNLLIATHVPHFGGLHVDFENTTASRTGLLYLDDTNGPTEFETGEKIECVSNRFVEFPGHIKHGSWSCTDRPYRRVVNFNWIP